MIKKPSFSLLILILVLSLTIPAAVESYFQPSCEEIPEYCEGGDGEDSSGDEDHSGHRRGPPWEGYSDGRINPDPADYYTIYCHEDTIFVVRIVPQNETIKAIPLIDAISLDVGQEQPLGDFMTMARSSEDIITIYGSNGNLAPESGSKSFSLSDCIAANGGAPELSDVVPPPSDDQETQQETEEEARRRARREANEALNECFSSYSVFGENSSLLVECLDSALYTHQDALTGGEILTLIAMIFCLNIVVGNGVLPIGIVLFLHWHRRWLRKQKTLG